MPHLRKIKIFAAVLLISLFLSSTAAYAGVYTVVKGDSLYTIGNLFGTTSNALMKENTLTGTMIYPGQKLRVPADTYTVKYGDSLYLIAVNNGMTLDALRRANHQWDNMIYPNQKLLLPGSKQNGVTFQTDSAGNGKIAYTEQDADLLARLITAEADSEPYTAKVGVGAVVLNRAADSQFPNTISAVIYEKSYGFYQFTPVENGWINKPASESAKQAAYEALQGVDPTNGAIYYFDDSATNQWLWSRPHAAVFGKMVYKY